MGAQTRDATVSPLDCSREQRAVVLVGDAAVERQVGEPGLRGAWSYDRIAA